MLTYVGRGYSPAFITEMDGVVARLSNGEPIEIVAGPDAICAAICDEPQAHCRLARVTDRDAAATLAMERLLGLPVPVGAALDLPPSRLALMLDAFASGESRAACADCEWASLCTAIAGSGFAGTRLHRAASPGSTHA